ncbi:MAG: hypothetical protein ACTHK7_09945 [Aureliella sp.]
MSVLQGHAEMLAGKKRHRIAGLLLLANVSLVAVAAVWRHAAADDLKLDKANDNSSAKSEPPDQSSAAPQVEPPEAGEAIPSTLAAPPTSNPASDPVMEELRKVISDPNSGLDLPRLDETSPLAAGAKSSQPSQWDARLEQRLATVHSLSAAALALVREARSLTDAGLNEESAALMQRASELRQMIAALAAAKD